MGELYKVKDFSELSEGEMVLAFGVHVLNWDFDTFGNPAYGIVPAVADEADTDALRAEVARLTAELSGKTGELEAAKKRIADLVRLEAQTINTAKLVGDYEKLQAELQQARADRFGVWTLKEKYKTTWREQPESYWFYRLMEEVGELGASLANDHKDPPEWEMKQIAAICLNWLEMRAALPTPPDQEATE